MPTLVFTPRAEADLTSIYEYIAADNPRRAKTFIEDIRLHCTQIAHTPTLHAIQTEIDATMRRAVHGNYLIFYDAIDDGVLVLAIIHGARNLAHITFRPDDTD